MTSGKVYFGGVGIGNSKDITLRVIDKIKECEYILLENKDLFCKMINELDIKTDAQIIDYDLLKLSNSQSNGLLQQKIINDIVLNKNKEALSYLKNGKDVLFLSDEGHSLFCDPGKIFLEECSKIGISHEILPSPSAVIQTIVSSSLSPESFIFISFIGDLQNKSLEIIKDSELDIVGFFSPNNLMKGIKDLESLGIQDRACTVCIDLTKNNESVFSGQLWECLEQIKGIKNRNGLSVSIVIKGKNK